MKNYQADVAIVGAGIAGIVTALELLEHNLDIVLIDRNPMQRFGGLANEAFGGMTLIGTGLQKLNGIKDSPELAFRDWKKAGEFSDQDIWPLKWAEHYVHRSNPDIYCWLRQKGIRFFPAVQWVERGDSANGNSVPRYHVVWGTGWELTQTLIRQLQQHPNRNKLKMLFGHTIEHFEQSQGRLDALAGQTEQQSFRVSAEHTVLACGGINGNLNKVKEVWDPCYGPAPSNLLNGSHPSADGILHDALANMGGNITHLPWMWNYAAGIPHPKPAFEQQGLSLIPPRSALWLDCYGRRIGPKPLVTGFDTHDLCKRVGHLPHQYSWQVMNWKIAIKEIAISGSEMNPSFRNKKLFSFLREILHGNTKLVQWMIDECPDVLAADSIEALADKMADRNKDVTIDRKGMQADIAAYDAQITRGQTFHNDDQLRRLAQLLQWRGDRARTCRFQRIVDASATPYIAIREQLISRKSMGGMQTDLESRTLDQQGEPIPGLYAVGEAAGFGGGGLSGIRSLEGTFLSGCILTARMAAKSISSHYAGVQAA